MTKATEFVKRKMRPVMSVLGYQEKRRAAGYNDAEEFIPDATPVAPPVGFKSQPSMFEVVRDMVRNERLQADLAAAGVETFEEADDFEVGDEGEDLKSGFENDFDPSLKEMVREGNKSLDEKRRAKKAAEKAEQSDQGDG